MKIIAWVNGNSGPSYHRVINPLLTMPDIDVYITNNLLIEDFEKGCDIFMYNRILPDHAVPIVKELQAKYGFKIVVDLDDYWELDEHHVLYDEYQSIDFAGQQVKHIREADAVFCTHDRLADMIVPFNKNVHVLPNAIPKGGQFIVQRERSEFVRLFWQGSITHQEDIQVLRRPIDALAPISRKLRMVMAGYTPNNAIWHEMALVFTAHLKHQYKLIMAEKVTEYYQAYRHADVCLCPLINSPFNRMKSNLKVLEAANLGLPVIASAVHPYLGMPVIYCKNPGEWAVAMTRMVASSKRRKEAGHELQEYCDEHFNFTKINKERKQILDYVAKQPSISGRQQAFPAGLPASFDRLPSSNEG